jgi:hypothetical protein
MEFEEFQVSFATDGFGAALPPSIKARGDVVRRAIRSYRFR